ncbi:MAG: hypothetical protein RLZZ297_1024 [Chloroflexota bacterium]|jgi:hemoglobin
MTTRTVYEAAGGDAPFRKLVDIFYRNVEATPILRPMFPADLAEGKEYQFLFITQYFGGPARYIEQRGHPRLRMRHGPFVIGRAEADAWLQCMLSAMDEVGFDPAVDAVMRQYFTSTATFMINSEPGDHRIALGSDPIK